MKINLWEPIPIGDVIDEKNRGWESAPTAVLKYIDEVIFERGIFNYEVGAQFIAPRKRRDKSRPYNFHLSVILIFLGHSAVPCWIFCCSTFITLLQVPHYGLI